MLRHGQDITRINEDGEEVNEPIYLDTTVSVRKPGTTASISCPPCRGTVCAVGSCNGKRPKDEPGAFHCAPIGSCFVLVLNPEGMEGLDLGMATHLYQVEPIHRRDKEQQARARGQRLGGNRQLEIVQLLVAGSIEEEQYRNLDEIRARRERKKRPKPEEFMGEHVSLLKQCKLLRPTEDEDEDEDEEDEQGGVEDEVVKEEWQEEVVVEVVDVEVETVEEEAEDDGEEEEILDGDDAICGRCGGGESPDGNAILLCDGPGCENAYHQKCLEIPLSCVPEGEWFCPSCSPAKATNDEADIWEDGSDPVAETEPGSSHTAAQTPVSSARWSVGTKVKAQFQRKARRYPATIHAVNPDGTFAVQYDDGDFEESVPEHLIHDAPPPAQPEFEAPAPTEPRSRKRKASLEEPAPSAAAPSGVDKARRCWTSFAPRAAESSSGAALTSAKTPKQRLIELKEVLDHGGLISRADFEEKKKQILAEM